MVPRVGARYQGGVAARALLAVGLIAVAATTAAAGWPTYLGDVTRSAAGRDTTISTANAVQLSKVWQLTTGAAVAASASVVNGVAYVGSWDGYEYAVKASTGAVIWKTYLGVTNAPKCIPSEAGVTSSATVVGGHVYVGGGDAYWYALDAATGAVQWKVYTGNNSPSGGHYNWSSPLIYNGFAYIGVASLCDVPLVRGKLLEVKLSTHAVVHTFYVVPSGQVGGGIWTSPSLDVATGTVYVTTGTISLDSQRYSEAILALDAGTLALKELVAAALEPAYDRFRLGHDADPVQRRAGQRARRRHQQERVHVRMETRQPRRRLRVAQADRAARRLSAVR